MNIALLKSTEAPKSIQFSKAPDPLLQVAIATLRVRSCLRVLFPNASMLFQYKLILRHRNFGQGALSFIE